MHQLGKDPDVEKYIQAETNYTNQWIEQSGIATLQKQLEWEMQQIQASMDLQQTIASHASSKSHGCVGNDDRLKSGSTEERLEGSEFWDLDQWRYWLDSSIGDYGVYKRRRIRLSTAEETPIEAEYFNRMERLRREYLATSAFEDPLSEGEEDMEDGSLKDQESMQDTWEMQQVPYQHRFGACSTRNLYRSKVQVVLDVNRLATSVKKNENSGEFSFGFIEIQPRYTVLRPDAAHGNISVRTRDTLAAYTYDTTGNERYHIQIMALPRKARQPAELSEGTNTIEKPVPARSLFPKLSMEIHDHSGDYVKPDHHYEEWVLKDAGPETRWVKLGKVLYLFYTKLDPKGLPREVWRVEVDSLNYKEDNSKDDKSAGETSSHSYFLNVDAPEEGWYLIRQGMEGVIYTVEHHSGYFYLRTNFGGAENFQVIRIPVWSCKPSFGQQKHQQNAFARQRATGGDLKDLRARSMNGRTQTFETVSGLESREGQQPSVSFFDPYTEEIVLAHDENEFLERFEVFVEHFVGWVWRGGLQEFRIFLAPQPSSVNDTESKPALPLKELQRVRPYHHDFKIASVMPSNIREEEQRLMREFFSTRLRYSNSSFVHPWALYEIDLHLLTSGFGGPSVGLGDYDEWNSLGILEKATRLVHQDPYPIGVRYGADSPKEAEMTTESLIQFLATVKDTKEEQKKEMAKFTEMRIMVPSTHGKDADSGAERVMIPISLIYYSSYRGPNGTGPNFPRPGAFVSSYGAYGTMTAPFFDPSITLPLLHRGLIYVQVHPRGDGVLGPAWYAGGKMERKRNTFLDVEDVLLYLRDSGMILPGSVIIEGRSAGGLVSGWMANRWGEISIPQRPEKEAAAPPDNKPSHNTGIRARENIVQEMVKVVLSQVPFVDVITDMSDPDIPWVEYEWNEWGSPLQSREIFEVMKRYSPYDCIRSQPYPAMMVMGGLTDSRVNYAEPLKYIAKLRSTDGKTNDCSAPKIEDDQDPSADSKPVDTVMVDGKDEVRKDKKSKMCAGTKQTPLLLRIEDGGHFSGNRSLWMAFALNQLGAEKVVTGKDLFSWN
ncbi:hypothetical protein BGZ83_001814 [Gryganskiella cystojenkinii]|nr:hypothetical protein BGZ83_001814 [Gryganskiella cystojenkinii]